MAEARRDEFYDVFDELIETGVVEYLGNGDVRLPQADRSADIGQRIASKMASTVRRRAAQSWPRNCKSVFLAIDHLQSAVA